MRREPLLAGLAAAALLAPGPPRAAAQFGQPLAVTILPARAGEAFLIRTPRGQNLLIGCGGPGDGPALLAELKRRRIRTLDALIVPYWGDAAIGGGEALLAGIRVDRLLHNPVYVASDRNRRFYHRAQGLDQRKLLLLASPSPGEETSLHYTPPAILTAVAPTGPMQAKYVGDAHCSLMLELRYDRSSLLYLGNSRARHQKSMWAGASSRPAGQVLLLSGGEAADSLDASLLKPLGTRHLVLLRGRGHPPVHASILSAARKAGIQVYRTDRQPSLEITLEPERLRIGGAQSGSRRR